MKNKSKNDFEPLTKFQICCGLLTFLHTREIVECDKTIIENMLHNSASFPYDEFFEVYEIYNKVLPIKKYFSPYNDAVLTCSFCGD